MFYFPVGNSSSPGELNSIEYFMLPPPPGRLSCRCPGKLLPRSWGRNWISGYEIESLYRYFSIPYQRLVAALLKLTNQVCDFLQCNTVSKFVFHSELHIILDIQYVSMLHVSIKVISINSLKYFHSSVEFCILTWMWDNAGSKKFHSMREHMRACECEVNLLKCDASVCKWNSLCTWLWC